MILPSHISQNQRNDVFVGNLAFGTTEDQLYQAFSDLGRIIKVRMVTDETGKDLLLLSLKIRPRRYRRFEI